LELYCYQQVWFHATEVNSNLCIYIVLDHFLHLHVNVNYQLISVLMVTLCTALPNRVNKLTVVLLRLDFRYILFYPDYQNCTCFVKGKENYSSCSLIHVLYIRNISIFYHIIVKYKSLSTFFFSSLFQNFVISSKKNNAMLWELYRRHQTHQIFILWFPFLSLCYYFIFLMDGFIRFKSV